MNDDDKWPKRELGIVITRCEVASQKYRVLYTGSTSSLKVLVIRQTLMNA